MKKLLACIIIGVLGLTSVSYADHIVPIKNTEPAQVGTISRLEVYWMYSMKVRFWENGQKITVFYRDFGTKVHKEFCSEVLRISTERFAKNVENYVNTGNASYFHQANDDADMERLVTVTSGSIGYISKEFVLINRGSYVEKIRIID